MAGDAPTRRPTVDDLLNVRTPADIAIGPDGKLYVGMGDGGSGGDPQNRAQNLHSVFGKLLRFNKDGTIPTDNPFYNAADGLTPSISSGTSRVSEQPWALP